MLALLLLAKDGERGGFELARLMSENGAGLAPLGVDLEMIEHAQHLPNEVLGPRVLAHLEQHNAGLVRERRDVATARAKAAAVELAARAEWREDGVYLPVGMLLGELLADASIKYMLFHLPGTAGVAIARQTLVDTARSMRPFRVLTARLTPHGLRIAWEAGRGQLRLKARVVSVADRSRLLDVVIERPRPLEQPAVARPTRRRRPWVAEVLDHFVFGT